MRLATLASVFIAGFIWFALASAPVDVNADEHTASCQTCGKSSTACPHCAAGKECPHCTHGKDCPHCAKGKSCSHCGHHGKWGGHKWEYKCVRPGKKPAEVTKQFTAMGGQGWKLVEADGGIWCFAKIKR
ncbi:MAG: hypothetical protein JSV06_03910 [Myxococcales bacterium]|nr:MAG: hypothetical protein JSV06_03910 [Myxococcales bacterium]